MKVELEKGIKYIYFVGGKLSRKGVLVNCGCSFFELEICSY